MLKLIKFHGIKGNNSFRLQHVFRQTHGIRLLINRALALKRFKYADWKNKNTL